MQVKKIKLLIKLNFDDTLRLRYTWSDIDTARARYL